MVVRNPPLKEMPEVLTRDRTKNMGLKEVAYVYLE